MRSSAVRTTDNIGAKLNQDLAWDLWLNCETQEAIADRIGVEQRTISNWVEKMADLPEFLDPPESHQHFNVWNFHLCKGDAGAASYFGRLAPQIMENLLWFCTEPGDTVVDLFASSGTTIDACKNWKQPMGG